MARLDIEEHVLSNDIITVSKNDGSKRRKFTDANEAEAYYEYLKREEVQDSIAKNQATAVEQNAEIIANQKRLIDLEEQRRAQSQSQSQNWRQQPYYDPEYLAWQRQKAEKVAQERADAERKRRLEEIKRERLEEDKLKELAVKIDKGVCFVGSNTDNIRRIIVKGLYTFTNSSVIMEIISSIKDSNTFWSFYESYPSYKKFVIKSNALRYADASQITEILNRNIKNKGALSCVFKNANSDTLYKIVRDSKNSELLKFAASINFSNSQEQWYQEAYWLENQGRIRSGQILNNMDLTLAERKCSTKEESFYFLKTLASLTKNEDALEKVSLGIRFLFQDDKITLQQKLEVYNIIISNPYSKFDTVLFHDFLDHTNSKEDLYRLKKYCDKNQMHSWIARMHELGYMTDNELDEELERIYPTKNSGCIWFLIIVLSPLIYLFF